MRRMNAWTPGSTAIFTCVLALSANSVPADIVFEDVSSPAGIERYGESYGASWGDLDGDGYPDLFVSMHRTPVRLYLNRRDGTFVDVASQTFAFGNQPEADTHGGTWFDFDNDGDQDLFVTLGRGNPDYFLVNERGALVNRAQASHGQSCSDPGSPGGPIAPVPGAVAVDPCWEGRLPVWLDYDGDRSPDFILAQGAGVLPVMRQLPDDGGFSLENNSTGLTCRPAQYVQLLDVTGGGTLELVCPDGAAVYPHRVWGVTPERWNMLTDGGDELMPQIENVVDAVVADFNNDGRMDIFLLGGVQLRPSGVDQSGNRLEATLVGGEKGFSFVSSGVLSFDLDWNRSDPSSLSLIHIGAAGSHPPGEVFELDPDDPVNHGMPDDIPSQTPIMRIGYAPDTQRWTVIVRARGEDDEAAFSIAHFQIVSAATISDVAASGLWETDVAVAPTLLINRTAEGRGFVDETADWGLDEPVQCVSATAGDFDNDMHVDLYLACRTASSNVENILYRNTGTGGFDRVVNAGGAAGPVGLAVGDDAGTADSVIAADYDLDGFLDLFVTNGLNMRPRLHGGPTQLYRNAGNDNSWALLDLAGTQVHREAIGTVVEVTASGVTQTRVKNGSYHRWSHDHTRMHFGLANAETMDVRIVWPNGAEESYVDLPVNRLYRAIEGEGIEAITPGNALPYPCGLPPEFGELSGSDLNAALGRGVYLGQECRDGSWRLRAIRGDVDADPPTYSGTISSTQPFEHVRLRNLQSGSDSVLCDGDPCAADEMAEGGDPVITSGVSEISYELRLFGGQRGIDFRPQAGATTCLAVDVQPPGGAQVYMGLLEAPVSNDIDLATLEPCSDEPPSPLPGSGDGAPDGDGDGIDAGDGESEGSDGGGDATNASGSDGGGGGLGWLVIGALIPALISLGRRRQMG